MALPVVRTKLKTVSSKNQGLQDILKSCSRGMEILSVEPHVGGIHNTKITLQVDLGAGYPAEQRYQKRVHFYNRVPMALAVPTGASYPTSEIEETIEVLNKDYGCDFTVDDVEISEGLLKAKATSLGYYNYTESGEIPIGCTGSEAAVYFMDGNYFDWKYPDQQGYHGLYNQADTDDLSFTNPIQVLQTYIEGGEYGSNQGYVFRNSSSEYVKFNLRSGNNPIQPLKTNGNESYSPYTALSHTVEPGDGSPIGQYHVYEICLAPFAMSCPILSLGTSCSQISPATYQRLDTSGQDIVDELDGDDGVLVLEVDGQIVYKVFTPSEISAQFFSGINSSLIGTNTNAWFRIQFIDFYDGCAYEDRGIEIFPLETGTPLTLPKKLRVLKSSEIPNGTIQIGQVSLNNFFSKTAIYSCFVDNI